tara:strand:- start:2329 stop:2859 length:531 start_codon:yes stop_codon:yes gene_type:complete
VVVFFAAALCACGNSPGVPTGCAVYSHLMDTSDLTEDSETSVSAGLQGFWLIYDGECPVCRSVAHAFAIRKKYGTMALVDARASPDHPLFRRATAAGLDLDEGMVIFADGQIYHGAGAASFLAKFGDPSHWLTKLGRAVNCSTGASTTIYEILRGLRNLLLRLRGIGRIDNLRRPD